MSARRLGRFAGLVFMLAALVGGGAAATVSVQHASADSGAASVQAQLTDIDWN
ncbi:hypothetical protein [Actinoplanes sp. N902-109]|uniref:hypothetical protein n=1 Tax=Actinoplanes sp. (strain N902-109) TaxID=649831 RepID=UPI0003294CB3|nr:hypothetical protein [Actinoplanes sp. N902-109]AGL14415.1 hypothetical protein L083_0905 [Actinoplanes sp. N902-109]